MNSELLKFFSLVGSLGGFGSILWLIVDWVRKDERQKQQAARIDRLELRLTSAELAHQQLQLQILREMSEIKSELKRIEGRDEGAARRRHERDGD